MGQYLWAAACPSKAASYFPKHQLWNASWVGAWCISCAGRSGATGAKFCLAAASAHTWRPHPLGNPEWPHLLLRMHDTARCWAWGVASWADNVMAQQVPPLLHAPLVVTFTPLLPMQSREENVGVRAPSCCCDLPPMLLGLIPPWPPALLMVQFNRHIPMHSHSEDLWDAGHGLPYSQKIVACGRR